MAPRTSARVSRPVFRCTECAGETPKWVGRCPECQAWGSVAEAGAPGGALRAGLSVSLAAGPVTNPAVPIGCVDLTAARAVPTGVAELDRVLGGGLVPGAVILLAGEPGVGKSTLLLEVAARCAATTSRPVLVVSGEESAAQVRLRAERTRALHPQLWIAAETDLAAVVGHLEAVRPALLVVDSVQTISSADIDGSAGGVSQVREVAAALSRLAKERGITTILVGHVTKDGSVAGPRVLEHLVDVVLHFEGERHSSLRLIRAVKNRFGPADEVGCFEMAEDGMRELADPSGLFLTHRAKAVPGTCVTVAVEGRRPLIAEVQALVGPSALANPRRGVSGLDAARVAMVLAVVERRAGVAIGGQDVYAATVGGVRLIEPAADLAVAVAIASAARDTPVPDDVVAFGELGLAGDVRRVPALGRRLAEALRLGFRRALVPPGTGPVPEAPEGILAIEVPDIRAALSAVFTTR